MRLGTKKEGLKRTPLYARHLELGAKMMEFAGWEVPLQYSGVVEEHLTVRSRGGLFDVSHMGQIEIQGAKATQFLNWLTVNDVSRLAVGQVQYSLLCLPGGGIIDDLTVYRLGENHYLLCVNAATTEKDFRWLTGHAQGSLQLEDKSSDYCLLALQGPLASEILRPGVEGDLEQLRYYWFSFVSLFGCQVLISRTGYTGEDGFELYVPAEFGVTVWDGLLAAGRSLGMKPIGLGARDTLRTEMRFALYGLDLTEETTPLEAGLGWLIKWDKGDFLGKEALVKQKKEGIKRKLIGLEILEKAIPRSGCKIRCQGKEVGFVTSGTYSPSLKKGIGLGYVSTELARPGQDLEVEIKRRAVPGRIVATPFYREGSLSKAGP